MLARAAQSEIEAGTRESNLAAVDPRLISENEVDPKIIRNNL